MLITHGRHDWIIPVAAAEEMAGLFPDARLVIFENSGHSPQIEEVELWERRYASSWRTTASRLDISTMRRIHDQENVHGLQIVPIPGTRSRLPAF